MKDVTMKIMGRVITGRDIMKPETKNIPADATMKESCGAI
jgi:hypothetical protein